MNELKLVHIDSIITRSSGSTGGKTLKRTTLYTHNRCSKCLTRPLSQYFTYINKCPTHLIWYGTSVSVFSFIVITHKLFINHGINVYVGRTIELQLIYCIYCIYFIPIPMQNGFFGDENASACTLAF